MRASTPGSLKRPGPAFETSIDFDHPRPELGVEGLVRLVRVVDGKQLKGVQVIYRSCAGDDTQKQQLRKGLHDELQRQVGER